jgi:hypothetical protein
MFEYRFIHVVSSMNRIEDFLSNQVMKFKIYNYNTLRNPLME